MNDLNLEINEIDTSNICFNGNDSLVKEFVIEFNSLPNILLDSTNFTWDVTKLEYDSKGDPIQVSVKQEITISENYTNLILNFIESNIYTISYQITVNECLYNAEDLIVYIGVNSNIIMPEVIFVGNQFDLSSQVSVGIVILHYMNGVLLQVLIFLIIILNQLK